MSVVNRALFLGPKYGDAHFLAARLLLRSGHRQQALEELRAAWSLTRGRRDVVGAAARWARTSEELLEAVPRSDPILEVLDAQHVARLVSVLVGVGEVGRARAVLSALPPAAELPGEALQPLSRAALRAGMPELALVLGRRAAEVRPGDAVLDLTLAQLARRAGRTEEARRIARAIDPAKIDPQELFGLRLRLAIEAEDFDEARDMVGELRRRLPVTRDHQTRLALQEASLHLAEGRPDRAVTVLGRAVDWSPADVTVRLTRARALLALGRRAEARVDLEFVLRRQPQHSGAKRLLREARPSIDATVTPEDESRPGRSGSF
jgi:predicted Zn-dependent protease